MGGGGYLGSPLGVLGGGGGMGWGWGTLAALWGPYWGWRWGGGYRGSPLGVLAGGGSAGWGWGTLAALWGSLLGVELWGWGGVPWQPSGGPYWGWRCGLAAGHMTSPAPGVPGRAAGSSLRTPRA